MAPGHLEHFRCADEGGQGRGECGRKDACCDEGAKPRHHAHDLVKRQLKKDIETWSHLKKNALLFTFYDGKCL